VWVEGSELVDAPERSACLFSGSSSGGAHAPTGRASAKGRWWVVSVSAMAVAAGGRERCGWGGGITGGTRMGKFYVGMR
jgi:hypothetical protein